MESSTWQDERKKVVNHGKMSLGRSEEEKMIPFRPRVRGVCDPVPIEEAVPSSGPSEVRFSFSAWICSHPGDFKHDPPQGIFCTAAPGAV